MWPLLVLCIASHYSSIHVDLWSIFWFFCTVHVHYAMSLIVSRNIYSQNRQLFTVSILLSMRKAFDLTHNPNAMAYKQLCARCVDIRMCVNDCGNCFEPMSMPIKNICRRIVDSIPPKKRKNECHWQANQLCLYIAA